MDQKIEIKEEPVWLEGSTSTSFDDSELLSEMTHLKEETKSEFLEPGQIEVNTLEPFADVNDEILNEENTLGQVVSCFKEEQNVETVGVLSRGSVDSCDGHCKVLKTDREPLCHLPTDTEERPFRCSECGKIFFFKSKLTRHMLIHSGEKPFCCSQCGKVFSQKCTLKTHMSTHFRDSAHPCNECGKLFSTKYTHKGHMLTHTEERPHRCNECGKTFYRKIQLLSHQVTHAADRFL